MKLTPPSMLAFLISLVLFIIGVAPMVGVALFAYAGWCLVAAWVVLAAACLLRGI